MATPPVELSLCPECDGLEVTTLQRMEGISSFTITLDDGTLIASGTEVYAWPTEKPCPNPQRDGNREP